MPAKCRSGILGAAALLFGLGEAAQAGAWPREKGDELLIVTAAWHRLDAPYDGDRLYKREAAFYGEYGLTDRITLVGRIAFQDFRQQIRAGDKALELTYTTFGGSEAGARLHLFDHRRWSGSGQVVMTLPSAGENRTNAEHGAGGGDLELRGLLGRSIGREGFAEAQIALRERDGEGGSEMRFDTALGWQASALFRVHLQTYSVWSHELDTTRLHDFSGHRVQLSLLASLGDRRYAQIGAMRTVRAHGMAEETAILAGVWHRF